LIAVGNFTRKALPAGLTLDPAKEYEELWNNKKVSGSELEKMVIPANHFLLIGIK
jgi:hypothetical protein